MRSREGITEARVARVPRQDVVVVVALMTAVSGMLVFLGGGYGGVSSHAAGQAVTGAAPVARPTESTIGTVEGRAAPEARGFLSGSAPSVAETLVLGNDTMVPGNYVSTVPVNPVNAVYDPGRGEIFIAEYGSRSVSVINDSTYRSVAQIAVGGEPYGLVYAPVLGEVFVSNENSGTVSVIADTNDTVVATVPVGDDPLGLAYDNSTNEVFVASWSPYSYTGHLVVISGATDQVLATIPVGSYPTGVAYDGATHELFVTDQNPGYAEGTVTVVSDASDAVVATIVVGDDPYGVAYDPALGQLFVADHGGGGANVSVSVISDSSNAVVANVSGVYGPAGVAYDNTTGSILVSEPGSCFLTCSQGYVVVINASNDAVAKHIPVLAASFGIAYDGGVGKAFVPNQGGGCSSLFGIPLGCVGSSVSVLSGETYGVLGTVALSTNPSAVLYDPGTGQLFIADEGFDAVRVVWAATGAPVANISLPSNPTDMAYDSGKGEVFVTESLDYSGRTVSVISDKSDTVVATVQLPAYSAPAGIAYDAAKGELFVADSDNNTVSVISDASNSIVDTITVGWFPEAVAYDPAQGELFVAEDGDCLFSFCSSVSVINDSNDSVVAWIPTGAYPTSIAYDSATGEVYVANEFSGMSVVSALTDSVIADISAEYDTQSVAYDPSNGLLFVASGQNNTVAVVQGGINSVVATLRVGATPYGLAVNASSGLVYCANQNQGTVSYLTPGTAVYTAYYPVTFQETGLQSGLNWTVELGGVLVRSNRSAISISQANGSYAYAVEGPAGWRVSGIPPTGTELVSGVPQLINLHFVKGKTLTVRFTAAGLALYQRWCVTLVQAECTTTGSLKFSNLTAGSYAYAVLSPLVNQTISAKEGGRTVPTNGTLGVLGSVTIALTFHYAYAVSFTQAGLTSGSWSITLKGQTKTAAWDAPIQFNLTNGTYGYKIAKEHGFSASGSPTRVTVNGSAASVKVTFTRK